MSTPPTCPTSLAGRLSFAREAAGLSSRRVSALAGIAQALTGQIERGVTHAPTTDTIQKIASVLGVTIDWLVTGAGPMPEPETIRQAAARAEAAYAARLTSATGTTG